MSTTNFKPDYFVPPGATLLETIEELGISRLELAKRIDCPLITVDEIIEGSRAITPDTALRLERILGVPASFWNNAESNYNFRRMQHLRLIVQDPNQPEEARTRASSLIEQYQSNSK